MKKVYVVTKGCYSDYHIVSVWSDKEKAEKIAKYWSYGCDSAEVEEWELDPDMPDDISSMKEYYHIKYARPIGFDKGFWTAEKISKHGKDAENDVEWTMERNNYSWFEMDIFTDCVKDEDHAIKIAQDKRAELIAISEGIT